MIPALQLGRMVDGLAFFALTLLVFVTPLLHGALDGLPRLALRLGVVSVTALWAGSLVLRVPPRRLPTFPAVMLAVYLALLALSALRAPYAYGSQQVLLDGFVAAAGFVLCGALARTRARKRVVVAAFLAGATTTAALVWLQLDGVAWLPPTTRGRASALFENPNYLAGLMDMAAPLALAFTLFARSRWLRIVAAIATATLLAAVGVTFSYGGWTATAVGTVAVLAAWSLAGWRRRRSILPLLGTLAVGAVVAAGALALLASSPRLDGSLSDRIGTLTTLDRLSSIRSRLAIQGAAVDLSLDHPLLGVGPGNFSNAIVAYRPERVAAPGDGVLHRAPLHAMSDVLNVATAAGIPAAAAFALFWLLVLLRAPPGPAGVRTGTFAGLLAIATHGLVDGNLTIVTGNAFAAFALAGVLHGNASSTSTSTSIHTSQAVDVPDPVLAPRPARPTSGPASSGAARA